MHRTLLRVSGYISERRNVRDQKLFVISLFQAENAILLAIHLESPGSAEGSEKSLRNELAEALVQLPGKMSESSSRWPQLTLVAVLVTACSLLYFVDSGLADLLSYDRGAIGRGQWWRFISANFLHTNGFHLALNLVALVAVTLLMDGTRNLGELVAVFFVGAVSVTVGLFFLTPRIYGYVGLSGVLHGLFVFVTWDVFRRDRLLGALLAMALLIKLAHELWNGPSRAIEGLIEAEVVTEAHFFGVLGGILGVLITSRLARRSRA